MAQPHTHNTTTTFQRVVDGLPTQHARAACIMCGVLRSTCVMYIRSRQHRHLIRSCHPYSPTGHNNNSMSCDRKKKKEDYCSAQILRQQPPWVINTETEKHCRMPRECVLAGWWWYVRAHTMLLPPTDTLPTQRQKKKKTKQGETPLLPLLTKGCCCGACTFLPAVRWAYLGCKWMYI